MTKKQDDPEDFIESATEKAKEGYDLRRRLAGVSADTEDVTVYVDQATGKELGGAQDSISPEGYILGRRRWGVLGRLDEIEERGKVLLKQIEREEAAGKEDAGEAYADEIAAMDKEATALKKKSTALKKKLESTGFVYTLRTVPDIVKRDARRKAKKELGIKGKGIPQDEETQEDFNLTFNAVILAASVDKFVDNADGSTHTSLSIDGAKALKDLLPPGQYEKLSEKILELSFEEQIGKHATDSADF